MGYEWIGSTKPMLDEIGIKLLGKVHVGFVSSMGTRWIII